MNMNKKFNDLQSFTVQEFQNDFDNLMNRVEEGESFIIKSEYGNAVMLPYKEVVHILEENELDDDLIRIHTTHGDGS